jgi:hypothetical protein
VALVDGPLEAGDRKALYQQCHVYVAPNRDDAGGPAIAEALMSGLPVVATSSVGHLDACDGRSGWLVDYAFATGEGLGGALGSVACQPLPDSLAWALQAARLAPPEERAAKAAEGRRRLLDASTWRRAARQLVSFAQHLRLRQAQRTRPARVGFVTTWKVRCGIADHVEHLVAHLDPQDYVVFAGRQGKADLLGEDAANVVRSWDVNTWNASWTPAR